MFRRYDLSVFCLLFLTFPAAKSAADDNNTTLNEVLCPSDSEPGAGGACVCVSSKCAVPPEDPKCEPPATPQRIAATGQPGRCCDSVDCLPPPPSSSLSPATTGHNCSDGECVCPEDSYRLGGEGCQCLPEGCQVKACPLGSWAKLIRPGTGKAGTCCPLYECLPPDSNSTCTDNGLVRQNGTSWVLTDCSRCRCHNGLIFCDSGGLSRAAACPSLPLGCSASRVPPGQCCPVCVRDPDDLDSPPAIGSCITGLYGNAVENGTTWQEDDCTSCVCREGQRQCQAYMCEACANPEYEPGECCPRCNGSTVVTVPSHCPPLNNCSLRCVHGFVRDQNGCFTCHCQQDECLLDCPHGFSQDQHGNKLCRCSESRCAPLSGCRKNCPHGFRTNKLGCEVCRCDACKPLDNCTKRCAHGLALNAKNCVICKCIPHEQNILGNLNITDSAVGTPCISDNKAWRDDGESWFDGCRQCYCLAGREMCSLLSCPPTDCASPVFNSSTDCCPTCPGTHLVTASHMVCQGEVPGKVYVEGETWRLSACVECVCQSGRALCHALSCAPTPCRRPALPLPGECCSTCPADQLNNTSLSTTCERRQGETLWREGNCVSCLCDSGQPTCFTELCDHQISCMNALQVKNQCCPVCLDKPQAFVNKRCSIGNVTYTVGDDWREDECTTCMCIRGGEISCTKLVCSVNCPNPIRKPGMCCHICPEEAPFSSGREVVYIVVLTVVLLVALALGIYCVTRQCRVKRNQLTLHHYGCPPPQYTQYKYMPTYDSPTSQPLTSEKTALTPL